MAPGTFYESLGPCPRAQDPRLPRGSGCAFLVTGDLDGDHRKDAVFSYGVLGPDDRAGQWRLRSVLASGAVSDLVVAEPYQFEVLGAADANGDGRDEVFAQVDHGASTGTAGVFTLDGKRRLVPVMEQGGGPLRFGFNGSVGHGDGGACTKGPGGRPQLVLRSALLSGDRYTYQERTYDWKGPLVVPAGATSGTFDAAAPDSRIQPFYEFDCGPLVLR